MNTSDSRTSEPDVRPTGHGSVCAISISRRKGIPKSNVDAAELRADWGIVGDAHAGDWHRQLSLLAMESIEKIRAKGVPVRPGAFAENITTRFLTLPALAVGTRLRIGATLLEITQIGKECHTRCAIYHAAGDCVMPREGIFARVLEGGDILVGDAVEVYEQSDRVSTGVGEAERIEAIAEGMV
jgi:molybdopterin adenylyltransferase